LIGGWPGPPASKHPTERRSTRGKTKNVLNAVKATGRKKLLMTALWTEACLSFPTLDAIREGYGIYLIVDANGGSSLEAHRAAIDRRDPGWRTTDGLRSGSLPALRRHEPRR